MGTSDTTSNHISDNLTQLLSEWIDTETWNASQTFLQAHADRLLSDEALMSLNGWIGQYAEDEDEVRVLIQHEAILEQARAESIEAAYAEILQHSPLNMALRELPAELREALESMMEAASAEELLDHITQHPYLLTSQATDATGQLIYALRQAGQERLADGIEERYNILKAVQGLKGPINEDIAQLLIKWINTKTWEQSQQFLTTYAERLLSDESLETLSKLVVMVTTVEDEGADKENKGKRAQTLLQHRALLERARTESIEAAYAELLMPSLLTSALQAIPAELRTAVQALIGVNSRTELLEQIQQHPLLLTPQAEDAINALLNMLRQANQQQTVDLIHERYNSLKEITEAVRDPLNIAFNSLMQADTPYDLQRIIAQHPILTEDETLHALDQIISRAEQNSDTVLAQRLRLRFNELRRIRSLSNTVSDIGYEPIEINADRNSIAVGRIEGNIIQTNIADSAYVPPTKQWQPPRRLSLPKTFIGRQKELQELREHLVVGKSMLHNITAVYLHGMGGIGKTYLAIQLSKDLQAYFPGGVIWVDLGPYVSNEERAQVQLRQIAAHVFAGNTAFLIGQLQPEQVASWLQEMAPGRLLVICDDVRYAEPLHLLVRALPTNAAYIITTRDANIAHALIGGKIFSLGPLSEGDRVALLEDRLACRGNTTYEAGMKELVTLLGGHPLALDIAASLIRYPRRLRSVLEGLKQGVAQRTLEQLKLPHGETRGTNLERSLALSYSKMSSEEQRRFRVLGVFSAEKPITVEAAAAVWGISDLSAAQNSLFELVDLALLDEMEDESGISYYQSKLLHLYAEALLDKAGELNAARWSHAEYYCGVVLRAEGAIPKDYPLLDRHIQNLLAALQWANVHEPTLFSRLVEASCRFLHSREQLDLLEFYLPKAINAATKPKRRAILLKNLGDLESRLGNVDEARAHYDAALPLYRAEHNRLGEANVLKSLGDLENRLGNLDQAHAHYDLALPLFHIVHSRLGEATLLQSLGDFERRLGHIDEARAHYDAALPLYRAERDRLGEANIYLRAQRFPGGPLLSGRSRYC